MNNNDQYIVKICKNGKGSSFFYKNGLLHREAGPAIVTVANKKHFFNLGDESLYKSETVKSDFPIGYQPDGIDYFEMVNGRAAIIHGIAIYYLEGKPYSQEQFEQIRDAFILKNQLNNELSENDEHQKKVKL